ncbi:hypothetical protein Pst134EB_012241 [Puccinia striiformis f. sp. tritici]|nr:hypothetical protein Pst134EB_012241 [Puccinia striiformis f. sp. tritici]
MSHSPVWYSSINDYKYIKKSISRQSWLAVTGKGGKRPQGPPSTRENPRVDGASRIPDHHSEGQTGIPSLHL